MGDSGHKLDFHFVLLYRMPAPSAECQHPEAWPASIYGHLREGYLRKRSQMKESAHFNLPSVATFCVLNVATVAKSNLLPILLADEQYLN